MLSITKISPEWGDSFIIEALRAFAATIKENPEFVKTLDVPGEEFQKIADHVLAEVANSPFAQQSSAQMEAYRQELRADMNIEPDLVQNTEDEFELTNEFIDNLEGEILADLDKEDNGAL